MKLFYWYLDDNISVNADDSIQFSVGTNAKTNRK